MSKLTFIPFNHVAGSYFNPTNIRPKDKNVLQGKAEYELMCAIGEYVPRSYTVFEIPTSLQRDAEKFLDYAERYAVKNQYELGLHAAFTGLAICRKSLGLSIQPYLMSEYQTQMMAMQKGTPNQVGRVKKIYQQHCIGRLYFPAHRGYLHFPDQPFGCFKEILPCPRR